MSAKNQIKPVGTDAELVVKFGKAIGEIDVEAAKVKEDIDNCKASIKEKRKAGFLEEAVKFEALEEMLKQRLAAYSDALRIIKQNVEAL